MGRLERVVGVVGPASPIKAPIITEATAASSAAI